MSQMEALKQTLEGLPSDASTVQEILNSSLFEPLQDLFARPSKQFRAALVRAGYLFVRPSGGATLCGLLAEVLETIHAGSLIIDDIQDGSLERRGSPSMHEKYGMPLALNAGNFLYFQPFALIESLGLPERVELRVYRLCHEAMLNAHLGQAIDLGTDVLSVIPDQIEDVCFNSSKLKTGSLTALAICLGAALAGADDATLAALKSFGESFGVALQRFDDIGNLRQEGSKRYEDLSLRRPSWAWALATQCRGFDQFTYAASCLPDDVMLHSWFEREDFFAYAQKSNETFLESALSSLKMQETEPREILIGLCERLKASYGTKN